MFAKAGAMIPLAPPPGLSNDGVGGVNDGKNAGFQPPLGMAQGEPGVLSWEIYAGSAKTGMSAEFCSHHT